MKIVQVMYTVGQQEKNKEAWWSVFFVHLLLTYYYTWPVQSSRVCVLKLQISGSSAYQSHHPRPKPLCVPSFSPRVYGCGVARQNGLQNSPDKTATIKSLYKELPPFLAWGHTPNCQIKITRMDETDNNWTISYQHLLCIHDTSLIEALLSSHSSPGSSTKKRTLKTDSHDMYS